MLDSKVIAKSIIDPDDKFLEELLSINGLTHNYDMSIAHLFQDMRGETKIAREYQAGKKVWHAKVIFIQLSKYQATFKISFNFVKNIAQLSKYGTTFRNISHSSGRVYIFWEHV